MKVEIYSTVNCPNCKTAIELSNGKVDELVVLKANEDFTIPEMMQRIGQRVTSFPQIFVNDEYVGGLNAYEEVLADVSSKIDLDDLDSEEFEI